MKRLNYLLVGIFLAASPLAAAQPGLSEQEPYDEFVPIVEVNATDGDVGFHVLLDGESWLVSRIFDSEWDQMLKVRGTDDLDEQGITELFIESAEPLCWEDPERDEDEEVVTLEEFIERFEAGTYHARGLTRDGTVLTAEAPLTHNLPAAPMDVEVEVEMEGDDVEVEISWTPGVDLGQCEYPDGLIPDPATVEVLRWEIAVEPDQELPDGVAFSKFTVQLPGTLAPEDLEVEVPETFIEAYLDAGVTAFKYEVGAREESGNQTFTEGEFDLDEDE